MWARHLSPSPTASHSQAFAAPACLFSTSQEKLDKGNAWAVCLDYLLASLDYEFFLSVAHDFATLQS